VNQMWDEKVIRGDTESAPTLRDLATVLFRQRRIFLAAASMIFAAIILYGFTGATYPAQMKILVRRGRADAPVSAQENAPVDMARLTVTEEELNSEVELLKDDEVLRQVVRENGLADHDWLQFLRPHDEPSAKIERAARRLAKKLDVEALKKTNLIAVSYKSESPVTAAKVLRSLANVYVEKHTQVHRPGGEFQFYEQQTSQSRLQLEQAQQNLRRFMLTHEVVAAAQQRDLTLQNLAAADDSYRRAQVDLSETGSRVKALQSQLNTFPERAITQVRNADNPELLRALKASLLDLELKRTGLLTKFEPAHALVQEVDQQIAQAKAAIADETRAPLRDETTDKNPNYEWAKAELQHAQVEIEGLAARAAATRTQVAAYQVIAQKLGQDEISQDELLGTEKAALESQLLYVKKQEEARMDDALDERGIVNVAIAEHPVVPALPMWSAWTILTIGIVTAAAGGTGAAFAADYMDPAFRTPEEAVLCFGAPVLASLPKNTGTYPVEV
jgi:uncharacterized protein involved in exopolysaccharide biosynthesis